MNTRTTTLLLILFFGGLVGLWWADYAKIPTEQQRRRMAGLVLPELLDTSPDGVRRVEIDGEAGRIATFERREAAWQMIEPVDALADGFQVESLVRQLKDLRPLRGSEALEGPAAPYGLDRPGRAVRLFAADPTRPIAALEVGKVVDDRRYVRPAGREGIEVVDARLLEAIDRPAVDWRQRAVFTISSFEAEALSVSGPGRDLEARRTGQQQWRLLRPIRALADNRKVEELIADLASLRVAEDARGFVADDVRDLSRYGLDRPEMTVTLAASARGKPQVLHVGKAVADRTGLAYARLGGQDDVFQVATGTLQDLGTRVTSLRSPRVADLDLARVDFLRIKLGDVEHSLAWDRAGWRVLRPSPGRADAQAVRDLLARLNELQAGEFLDPEKARASDPGLDPPRAVVEVWEGGLAGPSAGKAGSIEPEGVPTLTLRLGRNDPIAKMAYAQTAGDPSVMVVPQTILDALPGGPLAFRERTLLAQAPNRIARMTIQRGGTTFVLAAGPRPGDFASWRLTRPVEAPADSQVVARLAVMLAGLRAESLVADEPGDPARFGLDAPVLSVTWSDEPEAAGKARRPPVEWTLWVGKEVPGRSGSRYARLSDNPSVFTIGPAALLYLNAELRDRRVWSFAPDRATRLAVRWPGRTVAFRNQGSTGEPDWVPEPGTEPAGIPAERPGELAKALSALTALRFTQYAGPLPAGAGLDPPKATIEVELPDGESRQLRLGNATPDGLRFATVADGGDGPVFLLPEADWVAAWASPGRERPTNELPDDVFAPEAGPAP